MPVSKLTAGRARGHGNLRSRGPALGLGLALALTPAQAWAWHDDGHRIIGEIADRNLSPEIRAEVRSLLADTPGYDTLATAATWADRVAKEDARFDFLYSSHYVNLSERVSPRALLELCMAKSGCVAMGIVYFKDLLASTRATRAERGEALRFLAHFIGDAHQPLHTGRSEDRGGNTIDRLEMLEFTVEGRTNLHAVWDGGFVTIAMVRGGWTWAQYAGQLDGRVNPEMRARWTVGATYDWIEESRLLAAADAYLHADGITPVRSGDTLGEDWYERNLPVAEMRLQQAGVRLAAVLEEVL